jgi:hypothetical protein
MTDFHLILSNEAGFYIANLSSNPPSPLQDYSTCNSARLSFPQSYLSFFWSKLMVHNNCLLKQGWDLNPWPLRREICPLPLDHGVLPKLKFLSLGHSTKSDNWWNRTFGEIGYFSKLDICQMGRLAKSDIFFSIILSDSFKTFATNTINNSI